MARKKKGFFIRWILFLLGLLILAIFALFLVGIIWVGPLVKKAVETYGPEALGAEVKVEEVDISLFRGVAKVRGLVVGNPEGFSEPHALEMEDFRLNLKLASLRSDTIVIEDILIRKPVVTYEKSKGTNNLERLQENAMAWGEKLIKDKEKDPNKEPKKVIIKRLRIQEGTVRVKLPHLPAVPIALPDIERTNIGEDKPGGQNFGHATKEILASLNMNVGKAVSSAGDTIEKAAKDALNAGKKAGKNALKVGEKAIEGAGDKIKGLFGK